MTNPWQCNIDRIESNISNRIYPNISESNISYQLHRLVRDQWHHNIDRCFISSMTSSLAWNCSQYSHQILVPSIPLNTFNIDDNKGRPSSGGTAHVDREDRETKPVVYLSIDGVLYTNDPSSVHVERHGCAGGGRYRILYPGVVSFVPVRRRYLCELWDKIKNLEIY